MKRSRYSIDLFSGCGGLSLGLMNAGFTPFLANEIGTDPYETYHFNFKDVKLILGDIREVLTNKRLEKEIKILKRNKGIKNIDLVSGGPPCQGFSFAGRRKEKNQKQQYLNNNNLYLEMIRVINFINPNAFLFENVDGLLSSKIKSSDQNGSYFIKIWKDFIDYLGDNYIIKPQLLNSSDFGIPQNRKRIFLIGVQHKFITTEDNDFRTPQIKSIKSVRKGNIGFFSRKPCEFIKPPDPIEVIGDLDFVGWTPEKPVYQKSAISKFQKRMRIIVDKQKLPFLRNHEFTRHKEKTKRKFKILIEKKVLPEEYITLKHTQKVLPKYWCEVPSNSPNITITSMPDDIIHYSRPRTLSVRESARFQTFPDHFVFKGVRTTGGKLRSGNLNLGIPRVIPQYTQVGNAVPPILAEFIGKKIVQLIN